MLFATGGARCCDQRRVGRKRLFGNTRPQNVAKIGLGVMNEARYRVSIAVISVIVRPWKWWNGRRGAEGVWWAGCRSNACDKAKRAWAGDQAAKHCCLT